MRDIQSEISNAGQDPLAGISAIELWHREVNNKLTIAPVIGRLATVPGNSLLTLVTETHGEESMAGHLLFYKAPSPEPLPAELESTTRLPIRPEWYEVTERGFEPVILLGASIPGGVSYDEGVIKKGQDFSYRKLISFRRGGLASEEFESPVGCPEGRTLPYPELLPMDMLQQLYYDGKIILDSHEGVYRWLLPTIAYPSGPVESIKIEGSSLL